MNATIVVIAIALTLQTAGVAIAMRLMFQEGRRWLWGLISGALLLALLGRALVLFNSVSGALTTAPSLLAESVALLISAGVTLALHLRQRRHNRGPVALDSATQLQALCRSAQLGTWHWQADTKRINVSQELLTLWGDPHGASNLSTNEFIAHVFPDDRDAVRAAIAQAISGTGVYNPEFRIQLANGTVRWVAERGEVAWGYGGTATHMHALVQDITLRKLDELALREKESRLTAALQGAGLAIWDWNLSSNSIDFAPEWATLLGYPTHEVGSTMHDLELKIHPEDREAMFSAVSRIADGTDARLQIQQRLQHRDGNYSWFEVNGIGVFNENGQLERIVGSHKPIMDKSSMDSLVTNSKTPALELPQRSDIDAMMQDRGLIKAMIATTNEPAVITDGSGRICYANAAFENFVPSDFTTLTGQPLSTLCSFVDDQSRRPIHDLVRHCFPGGENAVANCGVVLARNNGPGQKVHVSANASRDAQGGLSRIFLCFRTSQDKFEMTSRPTNGTQSYDSLTGLADRTAFESRLKRLLAITDPRLPRALLYLDVDDFNVVNIACGRIGGDALLRHTAKILKDRLRTRDTLARLGGDKFGVLLEHCLPDEALRIAEQLRDALLDAPFVWHDQSFDVSISIGLLPVPSGRHSWRDVLSVAEQACNMAKQEPKRHLHLIKYDDEDVGNSMRELQWLPRIQHALSEDRFRLFYQPARSVSAIEPREEYGEVLLRMVDDAGHLVSPGRFIPAAERYEQMLAIDRWVVKHTFAALAQLSDTLATATTVAINISGQSLADRDFHRFVSEQLAFAGIDAGKLCFEITETAAISEMSLAIQFMAEMRAKGCTFALDDFGSGLSSFGYLKDLPVDYLKIDGSFVKEMGTNPVDEAMVTAMHKIGQVLGIKTIAESVEDAQTLHKLSSIGVHLAQGFHIEAPRPLN